MQLVEPLIKLEKYGRDNFIPLIRKDSLEILLNLAKGAKRILEVGTAIGYSACMMAMNSNAHIDTIEFDINRIKIAKRIIKELNLLERIDLYEGNADIVLPKIIEGKKYSLVFLDGAKSAYSSQLDMVRDHLEEDGYIFVDNVNTMQLVLTDKPLWNISRKHRAGVRQLREFICKITNDPTLLVAIKSENDGTAIIRKNRKNNE